MDLTLPIVVLKYELILHYPKKKVWTNPNLKILEYRGFQKSITYPLVGPTIYVYMYICWQPEIIKVERIIQAPNLEDTIIIIIGQPQLPSRIKSLIPVSVWMGLAISCELAEHYDKSKGKLAKVFVSLNIMLLSDKT